MRILTAEVLELIARSVAEAPPLSPEQARRLRAIWASAAEKYARQRAALTGATPKGS